MRIGFLHTVPALAARFEDALRSRDPDATAVHVVDARLLATAIATGVDAAVERAVADHVAHLGTSGADAILVTCSSIGEAVELAAVDATVPVMRVDAAMAQRAMELAPPGGRITVLATLEATLGPTGRLLARHGGAEIASVVVDGAAAARARGDLADHDARIADAVRLAAADADVVVLAQASMAEAAALAGVGTPVLSSPESGLDAVIAAVSS